MKKFMLTLVALITMTVQASAMSYEQARDQALFLTDKMAYELNLTDDQYEAAYEINLDYLMGINDHRDLFGNYWTQRNLDLSYILFDWQYRAFVNAAYFLSPALLGRRLLALPHLRSLPTSRLLLLRTPDVLRKLSRRTQLENERRSQLVPRSFLGRSETRWWSPRRNARRI